MTKRVALSWSGGKDGCLSLDVLSNNGLDVVCLVTTVPIEIGRTFGHGEKMELVKLQGTALKIPVEFISTSFEHYTDSFIHKLISLKETYQLDAVAFGDLYLEGHREWGEKVAESAGLKPLYPLWGKQDEALNMLENFLNSGYKATVIRIREDILDDTWLGRELDTSFFEDVKLKEMCPMGESGEYHTFVYDGPLFKQKIVLKDPEIISLETTKKLEFQQYGLKGKCEK
ncbi:diphthine--ammonia ligase [Bacillus sp. S/N-304-OC-R1]|uniref:Dph6-related ATP pyrophosphatase n=1 Tax=Bacillus sp. S/N-304-OC-R1 TaxID=2758034 RepID=UPI001C8EB2FE|nr:diphthine--ammonia ligase [Bacillus sp. S/N-304-OC-R1]MBY0120572.1 diphthine--ammonia ligase [Bacillus sp. S/N-304-OC-R1]